MTYLEIMSVYKEIQSLICALRSKVDDLESHAHALWEEATTPEDEAVSSMLHDELNQLSDVLSNWEGEDLEEIMH